jgi:hypothetical protein
MRFLIALLLATARFLEGSHARRLYSPPSPLLDSSRASVTWLGNCHSSYHRVRNTSLYPRPSVRGGRC